jgi:hypothetical protein
VGNEGVDHRHEAGDDVVGDGRKQKAPDIAPGLFR